jgi:hypothetical protein
VPVPRDLSRTLYRLGDGTDASIRWVPLVLVLEWTRAHGPLPVRPAKEMLAELQRATVRQDPRSTPEV